MGITGHGVITWKGLELKKKVSCSLGMGKAVFVEVMWEG